MNVLSRSVDTAGCCCCCSCSCAYRAWTLGIQARRVRVRQYRWCACAVQARCLYRSLLVVGACMAPDCCGCMPVLEGRHKQGPSADCIHRRTLTLKNTHAVLKLTHLIQSAVGPSSSHSASTLSSLAAAAAASDPLCQGHKTVLSPSAPVAAPLPPPLLLLVPSTPAAVILLPVAIAAALLSADALGVDVPAAAPASAFLILATT